jgi:sensor histidine kinase regulating citrate/malate metabolism
MNKNYNIKFLFQDIKMSIFYFLFLVIKIILFDKINSFSTNNSNNLEVNTNSIISNDTNVKRNLENDDDNYEPISIYFDTYYMTEYSFDLDSLEDEKKRI